jgi:hypothetical protein
MREKQYKQNTDFFLRETKNTEMKTEREKQKKYNRSLLGPDPISTSGISGLACRRYMLSAEDTDAALICFS